MSINERLRLVVSALGLNNNSLARKLNVSPTVTYNVLGGRLTKPSYELLEKIVFTFDNINTEWLLKEKGEMFIDVTKEKSNSQNISIVEEQLREMTQMNRELVNIIGIYAKKEKQGHG